jgi:hypothetical protein
MSIPIGASLVAFWPAVLAILAITTSGARAYDVSSGPWHSIGRLAVLLSGFACLVLALREASIPVYNRLTRDVVAFALIGFVGPAIAYAFAFARRTFPLWMRMLLSLVAGIVPLVISPLLLLVVHCTSGDCL